MKIKYFGYNSFIILAEGRKIAIDPGGSFYFPDLFRTVIPKYEWKDITHIIVTHGDPDHHWHTDRVAKESNACVICNEMMIKSVKGRNHMLGPRDKGLKFTTPINKLHTLSEGNSIFMDGIEITGYKGQHGSLTIRIGPFEKTMTPGENERIGYGEMVYKLALDGMTIINFGDSILLENEWKTIKKPDVLMIPIGGHNVMNTNDAIKAIKMMSPRMVIPCHYNAPAVFSKCAGYVDTELFAAEVEKTGAQCMIMKQNDVIII